MLQNIRKMNKRSASLLLLLLSADFIFIALHIINATSLLNSSQFNIGGDGAYAKIYQFVKLLWVIILLAYVLKSTRCSGYVSWILVFTYYLFDDALKIHLSIGSYIANNFDSYVSPYLTLQPRHFGEWAVLAIAGTFLSAMVAWAYFRSPHPFKRISNDMLLLAIALVFFGVFVDLAAAVKLGPAVKFGLGTVEDGGEIVVVSLILWYVFRLAMRSGNPDLFLHDLLRKPLTRRRV